ncbi:MAG: hypothetical protein LBT62_05680 [Deltaproteobacteria bacterium]|nr:hypothetical protein [Deltaproteobacteria bacterium]
MPQLLIRYLVNKSFDEGFWSEISTQRSSISPLLDDLTFKNVRLIPRDDAQSRLNIEEIQITGVNRLSLLKSLVGLEDLSFIAQGEITVRGVVTNGAIGDLDGAVVDTLYVKNLYLPSDPSSPDDVWSIGAVKVGGLDISWSSDSVVVLESISLFNLVGFNLGGLMISGLTATDGSSFDLDLNHASASDIDVETLLTYFNSDPLVSMVSFLSAFKSLDLSSLSIGLDGQETFHLQRAFFDQTLSADSAGRRLWSLKALTVDLAQLFPPQAPLDPAARAALTGLGHKPTADIDLTTESLSENESATSLEVYVHDSVRAEISLQIAGINPLEPINTSQLLLKSTSINLNQGYVSINSETFGDKFLEGLASLVFEGQDAKIVLKESLGDFLSTLDDPKEPQALNREILTAELNRLIDDPKTFTLSWTPMEGYPQSAITKAGGSILEVFALLSEGDSAILAEKYKYDIVKNLNLSLEVNGRAPVAVYLNH